MVEKHKVVLASGNAGKIKEFTDMLAPLGIAIVPQGQLGVGAVPETGLTFVENALIKARHACAQTGLPAIADDSGIEVDYLNGQPGIYSARFAGEHCDDRDNNAKLLQALEGVPRGQRRARYQCVLVYLRHKDDPTPIICQAPWEGYILETPRGEGGFGYDPLFWVPERGCASAELSKDEKNQLSHRGKAMAQLLNALATSR